MNVAETFGRYRLLERIGRGGMAEVFRAKSYGVEGFEKVVVIKRILPELAERPDFVRLFVQEAKLAVRLSHTNIVQAFDLGLVHGAYYIAMEYVHGADLAQILARAKREGREVPLSLAAYIAAEVAKGLDYAHRRRDDAGRPLTIVHCDVSPQNILVSFEGEVKVADFGIAKALGAPGGDELEDTQSRRLRGKFAYMSPEQARGEPVDARSDIFSLGIVLYECLTGANPFDSPSTLEILRRVQQCEFPPPELLRPDLPADLLAILRSMMAADREQRFADAGKLHERLLAFLYGQARRVSADDLSEFLQPFREPEAQGALTDKLLTQDKTPQPPRATPSSVPRLIAPQAGSEPPPSVLPLPGASEHTVAGQFPTHFGEKRDVTALAIDWPSEPLERERILLLLDRYGGRLVSDEPALSLVLFGLSEPDGRDTENAARCALAVLRVSSSLGIGMHTASIVVDGTGEPVASTAQSDWADTTRELARTAPARVTVSPVAIRLLPAVFQGEEAPSPAPRGARFLEPNGLRATTDHESRFVGRREELRQIGEAFALASRKQAQVVVISGVQGIGKSRLLAEVRRRIQKNRHAVGMHWATCIPHGRTFPYSGIVSMLQTLLGIEDGDDEARLLDTRPRLRSLGLTDDELAALYGTLGASVPAPQGSLEGALYSAFAQIVRSLTEDGLQVFAWDAAQYLDAESVRLLAAVHQRLPKVRSVFLFASRPGLALPRLAEHKRIEITLGDLPTDDTRALVEDHLGIKKVPEELLSFLIERAGGQPLFVSELARTLLSSRALTVAEGHVVELRLEGDPLSLPRTLRGLVAAHLASLATHERAVLQAMAVLDEHVRLDVLGPMLELDTAELEPILTGLVERDWLVAVSREVVRFRSPIVREVVEATLLAEARRSLHRGASQALAQVSFPVPPSRVALHLYEAGESAQASLHYANSAKQELTRKRFDAAARGYVKAFELCDPEETDKDTLVAWLDELSQVVRVARCPATPQIHDVIGEIDQRGERHDRVRAHLAAGKIHAAWHDGDAARLAFTTALRLAGEALELQAEVLSAAAEASAYRGDFEEARSQYAQLTALGTEHASSFSVTADLAFLHAATGDMPAARASLVQAERAAGTDALRDLEVAKIRGLLAYYAAHYADAALEFESAIDKARQLGIPAELAVNLHNLGDVLLRQGDRARAYGAFHQSLALSTEASHERLVLHNRMFVGYLDALTGNEAGVEQLRSALEAASLREFKWDVLDGKRLLAELSAQRGEPGAGQAFAALAAEAREHGHRALANEALARAAQV